MINFYNLLLLLVFTTTSALTANQVVEAYTEEENFDYINKVLTILNDENECQLPTYEGVDELQKSFRELEKNYGNSLEDKINHDQKLVRGTLLDQWDSFQARMTSAVVIRSAKKRSFLGKIESYQKGKYGHSICTQMKDIRGPITDKIFEKNPIVRYVKHLEDGFVPEPEPEKQQEQKEEETDLEKETEVIHTPISATPPEADGSSAHEESNPEESGKNNEEEERAEDTYDPLADIPVPPAQESEGQSTETITTTSTTTTEAPAPITESQDEVESMTTEPTVNETTTHISFAQIYQQGYEYIDDDADDDDLDRLDKVVPAEWNIDPIFRNFRWPDEYPSDNDSFIDGAMKIEWNNFLADPDAEDAPEQEQEKEEEVTTEIPEYVPRRLSPKELRRRRKELLDNISGERRAREQDQLFGWSHAPDRDGPQVKRDRWVNIADNNLCRISYNRDYIAKTRPVKALKSMFGSEKTRSKKAMMRRD